MLRELIEDDEDFRASIGEALDEIAYMLESTKTKPILEAAKLIAKADMVVMFGNGGSQAVASHFGGDLMLWNGPNVINIGDNFVAHSANENDYGFREAPAMGIRRIQEEMPEAARMVAVLISTSWKSENVLYAAKECKKYGIKVIAFTGLASYSAEEYADVIISVPGDKPGRVEAAHDGICHAIAEMVPMLRAMK